MRRVFLATKPRLLLVMLGLAIVSSPLLWGKGKPPADPPPTPPPAGTIYFQYADEVWGMKADGSGKFQALPAGVTGMPSDLVYGPDGHRWWLFTAKNGTYDQVVDDNGNILATDYPHLDMFAVSDGSLEVVQLTDLFGHAIFYTAADGTFNGEQITESFCQWSNDGLDTFVSHVGWDVANAYSANNGTTTLVYNQMTERVVLRVALSGLEIESGLTPVGPEALDSLHVPSLRRHHWSPDGNRLVAQLHAPVDVFEIIDFQNGVSHWGQAGEQPRWSPTGNTIAYIGNPAEIWTTDANGSGAALLSDFGNSSISLSPHWSPDGAHLMFWRFYFQKGRNNRHIYRLTAQGSGALNLTDDLNENFNKWPIAWVSDEAFAP